jgi:hypothetical protein
MKEDFANYIKSIGITEVLQKRIATIYEYFEKMCPDEITGIFVTDYIKDDVSREYEHLWFFSEKYLMEAKQFVAKDDFDMIKLKKKVSYWNIKAQDYDFKKATEKSRLNVYVSFLDKELTAHLKAARENCDYLMNIVLKHVIPNIQD